MAAMVVAIGKFFMGFGPFGGLLSLLFFILVIYLLFKIVRSFIPTPVSTSDRNDSLEFLKNRFARGEITEEEYLQMSEVLLRH
jgi:putative membrane protein